MLLVCGRHRAVVSSGSKVDPGGRGHRGHAPPPLASLTVWQWGVKVKRLFFPTLDTSYHEWT